MKKLVLLAAMLAMTLVAAAPATAQVGQGDFEQETESGGVGQSFEVTSDSDNASQCVGISGTGQSGTNENFQGFLQSDNEEPEAELEEGGNFGMTPEQAEECEQEINQAAAAGKAEEKKAAPPAPKPEAKAAEAKAAAPKTEAKKEEKKELPKTGGGSASLLALGAGALLVAGGLLARRSVR